MAHNRATTSDIQTLMLNNYRRMVKGEISETTALRRNSVLSDIIKSIEATETQLRLEALERAINHKNDNFDETEY